MRRYRTPFTIATWEGTSAWVVRSTTWTGRAPLYGRSAMSVLDQLRGLKTKKRGLAPVFCNVGSGPNGASPHQTASDRVVGPGDAVVCDWGGSLEGYNSDVTRTAHVGEPSPEFARAYEAVRAANQAAFDVVRPGVACQEVDRAALRKGWTGH